MDVTYAATCGAAIMPSPDDALTIEPPPVRSIALISSCTHIHAPRTLMSMTDSNCSSLCSANGCIPPGMPALLNAQSRRPWRSVASATSATTSSRRVTSVASHAASPPASETSLAVSASASSARSPSTTFAPSRANVSAEARPIPPAAPVITATLPSSKGVKELSSCAATYQWGDQTLG